MRLIYTGTVDASVPTWTPALPTTVAKGTYYKVSTAGNKIPTNGTDGTSTPYQYVQVGDAVVWNGTFWDVLSHVDANVTGTAGQISVTGTSDTGFTVAIDSAYIGQSSITTLGTIGTGTWEATVIDLAHGGTGTDLSSAADNGLLYKSGTGIKEVTVPTGTDAVYLSYDPSTSTFSWATAAQITSAIKQTGLVSDEFDVVASGATTGQVNAATNLVVTTTEQVVGVVTVYFNGLLLSKSEYTTAANATTATLTDVTLVDSALGYSTEAGDVIRVVYDAVQA